MLGIAGAKGTEDSTVAWNMMRALNHGGSQKISVHSEGDLHIGAEQSRIFKAACGSACGHDASDGMSVAFSGEIYNLPTLRNELRGNGHILSAESATEVILHLYREYGTRCVDHLRGMFAFAVADGKRLFLARDRLGIKPLYYALLEDKRLFLFASEIKALLRCEKVVASLDMQTFADSLVLNYPIGKRTFLENVNNVPPGSTMMICNSQGVIDIAEKQYYRVSIRPDETYTIDSAQGKLGDLLGAAVASHIKDDENIGITLSGGLDSSLLALLMNRHQPQGIKAFTIVDQEDHADLTQASWLAARLGAQHHVVRITFDDYLRAIPECIAADEQPSVLTALPLHLLCRAIIPEVSVFLTGEGADALFGGYPQYIDRFQTTRGLSRRVNAVNRLGLHASPEVNAVVETILSDVDQDTYLKRMFEINLQDQLTRNHLEIMDKHSMTAGLEYRLPYLDDDLVEFVNTLPLRFKADIRQGIEKYILKRFCLENYGLDLFDIVIRRKLGFPMACAIFYRRLNRFSEDTVPADYKERHELGRCFGDNLALLLFEMFSEIFVRYRGFPPDNFNALEFLRTAH